MIYRPRAAELEGTAFELAGGSYVALALDGAVHTVPAEVFGLLFEKAPPADPPMPLVSKWAGELMTENERNHVAMGLGNLKPLGEECLPDQDHHQRALDSAARHAAQAVAEVASHPAVKQPEPAVGAAKPKRHPNTEAWNKRDPETVPHCEKPTVPRANPTAPAPPKQSPAREKVLEIIREKGPLTTKEIGAIAYPDHDFTAATTNTYPITQALEQQGLIKRIRIAARDEIGTERPVLKWVVA